MVVLWHVRLFVQAQEADHAEVLTKENVVDSLRPQAAWTPATVGQALYVRDRVRTGSLSRATLRLTNSAVLRVRELTLLELLPPEKSSATPTLDFKAGAIYMFSREKPQEMHLRTPLATGALRGTEFHAEIGAHGRTVVTMFDGSLELTNPFGRLVIGSGEQATIEPGRPPVKTAVIDAVNIIQWCLYYPGVIDPAEIGLTPGEERVLAASLAAYRQGDLLHALQLYPAGRAVSSNAESLYRATLLLEVGEVERARALLRRLSPKAPQREAIEQLIAAVKFTEYRRSAPPQSVSEWLAESYYEQSRGHLDEALQAARQALDRAPQFGFAAVRVAELEFSFGRTPRAMKMLERGLELSPRHAQGFALQGFALAGENRIGAARRSFEQAIALDGALGNAWLGRGLTYLRQGKDETGRLDLQTAAALEPNRSILRSYLGKAFSAVGRTAKANAEFDRAKEIDPHDPTPYLYSAIEKKQENRYNEAIDDLEKSIDLNDNRRVYRSSFLLDQDLAVRKANLASIYQNNGLQEQSIREAVRAVADDYGSAGAHLFLANSYNALRDPDRIQLRYETVWFNELLLSNLLSPVGGGPLSQFVSEQEYSKLFERDGLGFNNLTEYYGYGQLRQTNSQYGTFGNISYAVDTRYDYSNGIRPNNRISLFEAYGTIKLQVTPGDTLLFQVKYQNLENGDRFQRYDPKAAQTLSLTGANAPSSLSGSPAAALPLASTTGGSATGSGSSGSSAGTPTRTGTGPARRPNPTFLTYDFQEKQEPGLLLLGAHHEWSPGNHTLLLLGRQENAQVVSADDTGVDLVLRDASPFTPQSISTSAENSKFAVPPTRNAEALAFARAHAGRGRITQFVPDVNNLDDDTHADFLTYSAELQQIFTRGPDTTVLGARFQAGDFHTQVRLTDLDNGMSALRGLIFGEPPADQDETVGFQRINLYFYHSLRLTPWLTLTGGVTYDHLKYPENFRDPPISGRQATLEKVSPKAGVIVQPWHGATMRAAYTEAINGASFDESTRLEPTQVAGFLQAYRSIAAESLMGTVAGSTYKVAGLSLEQKLPTRTYLGVEYNLLTQDADRTVGVFDQLGDGISPLGSVPSSLQQKDRYREDNLTATLNQLVGRDWSFGVRYQYTYSKLRQQREDLTENLSEAPAGNRTALVRGANSVREAGLHELTLLALYNHPSGFFARFEANWYLQGNDEYRGFTNILPTAPGGAPTPRPVIHVADSVLPGDDFWQLNLAVGFRFYRNRCELSLGVLNLTDRDYELNPLNPYVELPRERTLLARCRLSF